MVQSTMVQTMALNTNVTRPQTEEKEELKDKPNERNNDKHLCWLN